MSWKETAIIDYLLLICDFSYPAKYSTYDLDVACIQRKVPQPEISQGTLVGFTHIAVNLFHLWFANFKLT